MTLRAHVRVDRAAFRLDVALEVGPTEVVAVLGPNGAGKSTLLSALAGLTRLTAGRVELGAAVLDDIDQREHLPPERRRVGVVFQDLRLFPHLSARDNVAFGTGHGVRRKEAIGEATAWLDRLGLADVADARPAELSGGQAQRVALARALCSRPRLLLLDEPLSSLDVTTRGEVRGVLRDELTAFDGPAVLVTHDAVDALTLADRLLVLENGRVTQSGPPAQVARRPSTPYVAALVGLNLFRGTARDGVVEVDGGGRLVAPDRSAHGRVLAVVRPAAVSLHRAQPVDASARNQWPGRIAGLQSTGDRVRVEITGAPTVLADVTAQAVAELRLAPGDPVWVSLKATEVEVYPDPAEV